MATSDDELISAYLDGVSELSPDERKRAEAAIARAGGHAAFADSRALIAMLRALPERDDRDAPDWAAMERGIRDATAGIAPPRRSLWSGRLRWLAPISALAAATAAIAIWFGAGVGREAKVGRATPAISAPDARDVTPTPAPAADDPVAMYLDGAAVDLDQLSGTELDDALDALDGGAPRELADEDPASGGILPTANLGWIDDLDDSALDRAESWLTHTEKKKG